MSLQRTAFSLLQSTFQSQVQNLTYNLNFKDIIYNYIYITFSHLADALSKATYNEDNRRNQNQQKSNNMQVL